MGLGWFTFESTQFGNALTESDGGTFRNTNWLNISNANPGNPSALTGANFDTGIANIGLGGAQPTYTIGYTNPIVNGAEMAQRSQATLPSDPDSLSQLTWAGITSTTAVGLLLKSVRNADRPHCVLD